jgi:hypothetical protein
MQTNRDCTFANSRMTANKAEAQLYSSDEMTSQSANNAAIDMMLEVYKSVFDDTDVFYCSAPITSGKRYIDWLERIGKCFVNIDGAHKDYHESHLREVIEPNRMHAHQIIQELRKQTGKVVVNPTALPSFPGWTQRDWHSFWGNVIDRYVTTAFFINDWQYSNGCVYEFWVAQRKGIPTFDESKYSLSVEAGIDLITEAITVIQQRGQSTDFIKMILDRLKELSATFVESNFKPI